MPAEGDSHFFMGAVRPQILNSTLANVSGDYNTHYHSHKLERYGLRLLLDKISNVAFHDAAARGAPPKCHPDTRIAIRAEIMELIKAPEVWRKFIIWMYGPAGSGKTAIAQSIAEECTKLGLLAASFFFSRTAAGGNTTTQVVATLAYQLSRSIPEIREHILTAVEEDPPIFSRALSTQMQALIINPLRKLLPPQKPIFVILDGVDEIALAQSQADLLDVIEKATSELQHIPCIFLIASRPEYEIREAFNRSLLSSLTQSLVLGDHYRPDEDIKCYFNSTFQEIRDKHIRLGTYLPSTWPSTSDVDRLVSKASGQFIVATTVMKFVDSVYYHPPDRLDIVLGLLAAGNQTPFALLDALFHHILSSVADLPQVLKILMILILQLPDFYVFTPVMLDELLGFGVRKALVDMHALVFVPPPADNKSELRIHHASLVDFLLDKSRSHALYIAFGEVVIDHVLAQRWSKLLANHQPSCQLPMHVRINAFNYHYGHCEKLAVSGGEFADDLANLNLRHHLQANDCGLEDLYLTSWSEFFTYAEHQAGNRTDVWPRLRDEFNACILERLSRYPPSLRDYIPTIMSLACGVELGNPDIFTILLYGVTQSSTEFDEFLGLDSKLLKMNQLPPYAIDPVFFALFQDHSRAGQYYVYDGSYLALAKKIVETIFFKPKKDSQRVKFDKYSIEERIYFHDSDGCPHLRLEHLDFELWFAVMLSRASIDFDLARILCECALQYGNEVDFIEVRQDIAGASLEYIQRCGMPYLTHAHLPGTIWCIICEKYDGLLVST